MQDVLQSKWPAVFKSVQVIKGWGGGVRRAVALKQSHGLEETGSHSNCMLYGILDWILDDKEGTGGKANENRIKSVHCSHCFSAVSFKCQHKKLKGKSTSGREQREKNQRWRTPWRFCHRPEKTFHHRCFLGTQDCFLFDYTHTHIDLKPVVKEDSRVQSW